MTYTPDGARFGTRFKVLGDSRCAGGFTATGDFSATSIRYLLTNSFYGFAFAKIDGRATLDPYAVYALGGWSTTDAVSTTPTAPYDASPYSGAPLLTQALANTAKNLIVALGVNGGLTLAANIASMTTILDNAGANGDRVFLLNEMPNGRLSGSSEDDHIGFHEWCASPNGALKNRPWVVSIDSWGFSIGNSRANFRTDGDLDLLHERPPTYMPMGYALAQCIKSLIPLGNHFKLYEETATGALTINSATTGTSGTLTTGVTGSLATGFTTSSQSSTGLTIVGSKEVDASGREWQKLALGGSVSNAADGGPSASATHFYSFNHHITEAEWAIGANAALGGLVKYYDCQNLTGAQFELAGTGDISIKARALEGYLSTENRHIGTDSDGVQYQVTPVIPRSADATPSSSGISANFIIQVNSYDKIIVGAYRKNNYVTVSTTVANGVFSGNVINVTGLTSDYNITGGVAATTVPSAPGSSQKDIIIAPLTSSGVTVTATTSFPHSLLPGQCIDITNVTADYRTPLKTASTISFVAATQTILDSGSGFVTAGFAVGQVLHISGAGSGSCATSTTLKQVRITVVTAGVLTVDGTSIVDQAAGSTVTLRGSVRVKTVPTTTTFTYDLAAAPSASPAADQVGSVAHGWITGSQATYYSVGSDGEAADADGRLVLPVSGTVLFSQPTVRLV